MLNGKCDNQVRPPPAATILCLYNSSIEYDYNSQLIDVLIWLAEACLLYSVLNL